MKTNFDLVKDRSVVMDGDGSSTMPYKIFPTVKDFVDFLNLTVKEDILDKEEKKYIKNIVRPFRNQIIDICKNQFDDKYEYIYITYQEENTLSHGIIDLLIEREDKMIIVDYKLKNIDDPLYDKQLNGYRKVIKDKTNKDVECYLYSIIDNKFRQVKEQGD